MEKIKTSTSLIDIVKDSCNSAFESIKATFKNTLPTKDYICSIFRNLVYNELSEKLTESNYKFTQVYDCFIEIYYDKFYDKLLNMNSKEIKCENCDFCAYPRTTSENNGQAKCKLMKYKTIDVIVSCGFSPKWCPLNKQLLKIL